MGLLLSLPCYCLAILPETNTIIDQLEFTEKLSQVEGAGGPVALEARACRVRPDRAKRRWIGPLATHLHSGNDETMAQRNVKKSNIKISF